MVKPSLISTYSIFSSLEKLENANPPLLNHSQNIIYLYTSFIDNNDVFPLLIRVLKRIYKLLSLASIVILPKSSFESSLFIPVKGMFILTIKVLDQISNWYLKK